MSLAAQLFAAGLVVGAIYGFFALGFAVVFGVTRVFHLAHGAVYVVSAYIFYLFYIELALPALLALPVAAVVAVVLGVLCELIVYRPLRARGGDEATTMVVALGIVLLVENGVAIIFGTTPRGFNTGAIAGAITFLDVRVTIPQLQIVGAALLTLGLTLAFTRMTRVGRNMVAVADNPELAEYTGISVRRTYTWAFAVGSVVAAVAAVMVGRNTGLYPTMGLNPVLVGAVAVIVAGNGRVVPAFSAGVVMGLIESLAVLWIPSGWQPSVLFGFLIVILLLRPYGLFSSKERSFVQWSF